MANKKNTNKSNNKATKKIEDEKVAKVEDEVKSVPSTKEEKVTKNIERKTVSKKAYKEDNITISKKTVLVIGIVLIVLIAAIIYLIFSKYTPKLQDGKEVVASIDGKKITAEDLYEELKNSYGTNSVINLIDNYIVDQEVEVTEDMEDYAQQVVDYYKQYASYYGVDFDDFLTQYVGISGVTNEDEFYEYVLTDQKKLAAAVKLEEEELTEDEINSYYETNYSDKYTVKHILIEIDDDDEDAAYKEAAKLIKKLQAKQDDADALNDLFDEYAEKYSTDSSTASNGGLIEDFTKADVVSEFWDACEELEDGELTATPVKTTYGYHIILKVSTTEQEPLDEIRDEVVNALATENVSNDSNLQVVLWNKIREKYNLSINDSSIKSEYEDTIKQYTEALNSSDSE